MEKDELNSMNRLENKCRRAGDVEREEKNGGDNCEKEEVDWSCAERREYAE